MAPRFEPGRSERRRWWDVWQERLFAVLTGGALASGLIGWQLKVELVEVKQEVQALRRDLDAIGSFQPRRIDVEAREQGAVGDRAPGGALRDRLGAH